ncbi:MAG: vWA domain-containing protein [Pseudomonadota bacterium]
MTSTTKSTARLSGVHSYILLDRTGSMSGIWDEALGSVNAYAHSVGEKEKDEADIETVVNLAVFDSQNGLEFDVLRRKVNAKAWREVTNDEARPRGMTPLFDAIGRLVSMAESDGPEKAVLVIMTDGHENASREMTSVGAKVALDRARSRGWEVVFLGAEFANFSDAQSVGVGHERSMAFSHGRSRTVMYAVGKKSRGYALRGEDVVFDQSDRECAEEEDVKRRKGS